MSSFYWWHLYDMGKIRRRANRIYKLNTKHISIKFKSKYRDNKYNFLIVTSMIQCYLCLSNTKMLCWKQVVCTSWKLTRPNTQLKSSVISTAKVNMKFIYLSVIYVISPVLVKVIPRSMSVWITIEMILKNPNVFYLSINTLSGHYFSDNAQFNLIEMLTNTNQVTTETLKERRKNWLKFFV